MIALSINGTFPLIYRRNNFDYGRFGMIYLSFEGQEFFNEVHVHDEAIIILLDVQKSHDVVGFLLLHLLSERAKDLLDLGAVDLLAAVLVEDFEALNVVLFASGVSGDSLRLLQDRVEIGKGDPLGTQFGGSSEFNDGFVGESASKSSQDIAQVKGINIIAFVGLVENNKGVLRFTHFDVMRSTVQKENLSLKIILSNVKMRRYLFRSGFYTRGQVQLG